MKHFIITKAAGLNILWLWDSRLEYFQKLDEGIFARSSPSNTEAQIGDSEKDFRFFWLEDDNLFQTPEHCSAVKNYKKCLLYQKNNFWYLKQDKSSDKEECLGTADNYKSTAMTKETFYIKDISEKDYIISFLTIEPFSLVQKKYCFPYCVYNNLIIVGRKDEYFDIYQNGRLLQENMVMINDYRSPAKIYGYVQEAEAYRFLASELSAISFNNAYLALDKEKKARLYFVENGNATMIDRGKLKESRKGFQINDKLYPVVDSSVQSDKARLTVYGKIKNFFFKKT